MGADDAAVLGLYQAINDRRFETFDTLLTDDWIDHLETGRGHKTGFIATIRQVVDALPDLRISVEAMLLSSNHVTARVTLSGTHSGDFLGVAATGRALSIRAHDIHRIAGNRIAESWQVEDWFSAFEQMTALPSHPAH